MLKNILVLIAALVVMTVTTSGNAQNRDRGC